MLNCLMIQPAAIATVDNAERQDVTFLLLSFYAPPTPLFTPTL